MCIRWRWHIQSKKTTIPGTFLWVALLFCLFFFSYSDGALAMEGWQRKLEFIPQKIHCFPLERPGNSGLRSHLNSTMISSLKEILVFCCDITSHYKFRRLKQYPFWDHSSRSWKSGPALQSLSRVSESCNEAISWWEILSGGGSGGRLWVKSSDLLSCLLTGRPADNC